MPRVSATAENAALTAEQTPCAYISLHTADPGTTGASEVTGGSYARVAVSWAAASAGSMSNSNALTVNVPASTTISYFGLWSASTAGTYEIGGALAASQTYGSAGTYVIPIGSLTLTAS